MIVFTSCYSTVKVHVDVVDRFTLERSIEYQYFMLSGPLEYKMSSKYMSIMQDTLYKTIKKILEQNSAPDLCNKIIINADVIEKASKFGAKNMVDSIESYYQKAYNDLIVNDNKSNIVKIRKEISEGDFISQRVLDYIINYLNKSRNDTCAKIKSPQLNNIGFIDEELSKIDDIATTFGNSIIDDPLASLVVKMPNKYWKRYNNNVNILTNDTIKHTRINARVNNTTVRTLFGNADIAIKMDDPGNYIVKGVRLDADQAIKTSFKVLTIRAQKWGA